MDKAEFQSLLEKEVSKYKSFLETSDNQWIVKGFIDTNKKVYSITNDTKVVSKIIEILLIPKLESFAKSNGLILEYPSKQNYYPDLTFKDSCGNLFAVDFKTSYYLENKKVNGLTLGSYWGYFRNRDKKMNMDYKYGQYKSHLVLGVLYKQSSLCQDDVKLFYGIDDLPYIKSVIEHFVFFVQPKWKIAADYPGSGNTRNIGGEKDLEKLLRGEGVFSKLGENVFDDYWMNYFNANDARNKGIGTPKYHNLETYKEYLKRQRNILSKL